MYLLFSVQLLIDNIYIGSMYIATELSLGSHCVPLRISTHIWIQQCTLTCAVLDFCPVYWPGCSFKQWLFCDIPILKWAHTTNLLQASVGFIFSQETWHLLLLNTLSDFFRGPTVPSIRLAGLEYVLHFTAVDGKIYMRSYK